jgi:hypothetical protein
MTNSYWSTWRRKPRKAATQGKASAGTYPQNLPCWYLPLSLLAQTFSNRRYHITKQPWGPFCRTSRILLVARTAFDHDELTPPDCFTLFIALIEGSLSLYRSHLRRSASPSSRLMNALTAWQPISQTKRSHPGTSATDSDV